MFLTLATLLCFFSGVLSVTCPSGYSAECIKTAHTLEYTQNYNSNGNDNNYFFDSNTFGVDLIEKYNLNPCEKYDRTKFIKLLYKYNIKCNGCWCTSNNCGHTYKKYGCYEMEHIFDKDGCQFTDSGDVLRKEVSQSDTLPSGHKGVKLYLPNLVMASRKWNRQVSHRILGCVGTLKEKTQIYGQNKIDKITQLLGNCSKPQKRHLEQDAPAVPPVSPIPTPIPDNVASSEVVVLYDEVTDFSTMNNFNFTMECEKACTCESNKYLDVLCGCDYSETDFDYNSCVPITNVASASTSAATSAATPPATSAGNIVATVVLVLIIVGLLVWIAYLKKTELRIVYENIKTQTVTIF